MRIDENFSAVQWAADPRQWAILGDDDGAGDLMSCGFGYHAGDPVNFPIAESGPEARVREPLLG